MTVNTNDLVTTVAYMIGVKKDIIEQYYGEDCRALIDELYENQNATIIRYLCSIRTTLLQKFKDTDNKIRYEIKNLNTIEWFNKDEIRQLNVLKYKLV